ncbi:hypothetical protein JTB14_012361 [Gonioctena quinquepunctata]|nr:hypothetical protein JTB14_012361 [Gonioctena quinquepunctata]
MICYRIGTRNDVESREINLKLKNDEVKQQINSKKKLLEGTGIIIRQDLTISRVELLNDTISKFGLKQVWTESGKIFLNTDNEITMIRGEMNLEKCTQN